MLVTEDSRFLYDLEFVIDDLFYHEIANKIRWHKVAPDLRVDVLDSHENLSEYLDILEMGHDTAVVQPTAQGFFAQLHLNEKNSSVRLPAMLLLLNTIGQKRPQSSPVHVKQSFPHLLI